MAFFAIISYPSMLMESSLSCALSTSAGAPDISSLEFETLGKAITSRRLSQPQSSIVRRSSPMPIPPCGGAPKRNASVKKPNFAYASSSESPNA